MKIFYGFCFLAAGQTLGVNGWAIRWLSPPIDGEGVGIQQRERLVPRHHQKDVQSSPTGSLDLRTVVGTGVLAIGNATATVLDTLTINPLTISLPTGLVTDTVPATGTGATDAIPRRTVTVTKTEIAFATTTATADSTTTSALVAVVTTPGGFGGIPGQIAAASAPTAGQVVTIAGGEDSFGGVVGVIVLEPSATTSTTSDTSSASSIVTLPVDTPLAVGGTGGFGGVVGAATVGTSTDFSTTTSPDTAATTLSAPPALVTPEGGVGAFGGVVGIQVNPVNLVSTASSFAGFGGVAGLVAKSDDNAPAATPVTYGKRNTFERAVNIEDGVPGILPSRTKLTSVNGGEISMTVQLVATPTATADVASADDSEATATMVIVTLTTTVDPVVTVLDTVAPTFAISTTASTTTSADPVITVINAAGNTTSATPTEDVVTVTETITSTINVPATAPTSLPSLTIGELFPQCANFTGNVSALANLTIPDIVLPSNLTLLQVFNISGEAIDCSILLQLLGVNQTSTSLRKRAFYGARKTLHRFARGGR
jgi:hypothetical protein